MEKDIKQDYLSKGGDLSNLPKLPPCVGGDTDIMLGIQYLKYFPKEIHRMENGLALFESPFMSYDKSRGTVGGPHKSFNLLHKNGIIRQSNLGYAKDFFVLVPSESRIVLRYQ